MVDNNTPKFKEKVLSNKSNTNDKKEDSLLKASEKTEDSILSLKNMKFMSDTGDMTNWNALMNGAILIHTFTIRFQVKSAQDNIHMLVGIGEDLDNSDFTTPGSCTGSSLNTQHFKGVTSTNFYASSRYMCSFGADRWSTNRLCAYDGHAYVGNYSGTTINSYWYATYATLRWCIIYRGVNTGT